MRDLIERLEEAVRSPERVKKWDGVRKADGMLEKIRRQVKADAAKAVKALDEYKKALDKSSKDVLAIGKHLEKVRGKPLPSAGIGVQGDEVWKDLSEKIDGISERIEDDKNGTEADAESIAYEIHRAELVLSRHRDEITTGSSLPSHMRGGRLR